MSILPPFQGRQIRLRAPEPGDVAALAELLNQPALAGRRYLPHGFPEQAPLSTRQVERILERWTEEEEATHLAVVLEATAAVIGHAGFDLGWDPHNPSLHVLIHPEHQRKGHGTETVQLLLDYLFGFTPAHSVTCWLEDWNVEGLAFAGRVGFRTAGRLRSAGRRAGATYDLVVLDLLAPEWGSHREEETHAAGS